MAKSLRTALVIEKIWLLLLNIKNWKFEKRKVTFPWKNILSWGYLFLLEVACDLFMRQKIFRYIVIEWTVKTWFEEISCGLCSLFNHFFRNRHLWNTIVKMLKCCKIQLLLKLWGLLWVNFPTESFLSIKYQGVNLQLC